MLFFQNRYYLPICMTSIFLRTDIIFMLLFHCCIIQPLYLYLIILNDIHSKSPFLRNKFNLVTISFFHFQFRLVSSNSYILYYASQSNTIYSSLILLHYSASEQSRKENHDLLQRWVQAKRISYKIR